MIVVATADFELYHGVVTELRDRGVTFTTIEPDESLPDRTEAVVVGPNDAVTVPDAVAVVEANPAEPRRAVEDLLAIMRGEAGRIVVGVDPGEKPGIAVLAGEVVIGAFQVPADQVGEVVRREVEEATDPLVRIGDGARLIGSRIVDDLADVPVEVVDETGTTPYLGTGTRGMGDVLAAVNIARIEGERVDSIDIEPTAGELQRIKERSREAGADNRAIDERLARRVAAGELTIEEALAEHRSDEK
ncbi:hypothetical protein HLRTI_002484 [Halorhabdus tiamatea SARL4B]|uniref:Uncharacterized protein n=1 Tax=Halorhabdus tiamatea SARL4B TaxID=1033806 RepID=F7PM89_9EURY|nr:hypothetical protein [Halorhabdus tiamatea]ERJ05506.1 hypothetical protein HLRTI_002484 [Halorhabdus tiamatea SARL4B]CCQ32903.1 conserved hypothetical protein [Halorhabdus tiamatea SARL4B]